MKKKGRSFLAIILCTVLTITMANTVSAITGKVTQEIQYNNISVILDGNQLNLKDTNGNSVEPFICNGSNYLPVRAISEALGMTVEWNSDENSIILTSANDGYIKVDEVHPIDRGAIKSKVIQEVQYNNISVILDGKQLDLKDANGNSVEPFIYNGTNYLPVRAISEALGMTVVWDGDKNAIILTSSDNARIKADVVRTVDGDTIVVNIDGQEETVRLIGIDTPESVHPTASKNTEAGVAASLFTAFFLSNRTVELELDVQERDQYGRLLAYVYTTEGMFNEKLLRTGYASVATYPPNVKYVDRFTSIERNRDSSIPSGIYCDGFMEVPSVVYQTSNEENGMLFSLLYAKGEIIAFNKTEKNEDYCLLKTKDGYTAIVNVYDYEEFKDLKVGNNASIAFMYSDTEKGENFVSGVYVKILQIEKYNNTENSTNTNNSTDSTETNNRTVYITKTGKHYHYSGSCNGGTYKKSTLSEAKRLGLTPCSKCVK